MKLGQLGRTLVMLSFVITAAAVAAEKPHIAVSGLFKGRAIIQVNGQQHLLKEGQRSPEGLLLVSASTKEAEFDWQGQRFKLGLSRSIAGSFAASEKAVVRLPSGRNGHYYTQIEINGRRTNAVIDTGASTVAMSADDANRLGIRYQDAKPVVAVTANGQAKGYRVFLRRVALGAITLDNVDATVIEGSYPIEVLIGNSFLGSLDMQISNGVLELKSKY